MEQKINIEEIEKELGPQLRPEDFYFAVLIDNTELPELPDWFNDLDFDDDDEDLGEEEEEDVTTYDIWIAEKKPWDADKTLLESPVHAGIVDAHSYIKELLEEAGLDHIYGSSFSNKKTFESLEAVKKVMEDLGFTYSESLEETMGSGGPEDNNEPFDQAEVFSQLRPGDEELYKRIVEVFENCKEEKLKTDFKGKENYATDVDIPDEVTKKVTALIPADYKYERWDIEEGNDLCCLQAYVWQGDIDIVVDGAYDCELLSFPVEVIQVILDHLGTYTPETLPLKLATA